MDAITQQQAVQEYYGKILRTRGDLKTGACCSLDDLPAHLRPLLENVHPVVKEKFYGCASPFPFALRGQTVLDLGCGAGRDCYLLAQLVGPTGRVIGVDMTSEQLAAARQYLDWHRERFGYAAPNVEFRQGFIENLRAMDIADNSIDVVVSNCVINLSPRKEDVFGEIFRVLKPGGELLFADVFTGRRAPAHLASDPVLVGECLGGAMYIEDFRRLLRRAGCLDFRVVSKSRFALHNPEIEKKAGMIDFYSMTVRAFKLDLEDLCENFGHVAWYRGTIPEAAHVFWLDGHHEFKTGQPAPVCGNTAKMLGETRYREHFKIAGDFSTHYGLFPCGPQPAAMTDSPSSGACC